MTPDAKATKKQFDLLKKYREKGILGEKGLTTPLTLTNEQAVELGYAQPGTGDFTLEPTDIGEPLFGGIPEPTRRIAPEPMTEMETQILREIPDEELQFIEPVVSFEDFSVAFSAVFPQVPAEEIEPFLGGLVVSEDMPRGEQIRAETAQNDFFDTIQSIGRTNDVDVLLSALVPDMTEDEKIEFFKPVSERVQFAAENDDGDRISEGFFGEFWKSIRLNAVSFVYSTFDYFTTVVPEYLFGEVRGGDVRTVTGLSEKRARELGFVITEREAEAVNKQNKKRRDAFRETAAWSQDNHRRFLEKNTDLQPPTRYQQDLTQNWSLLKDAGYWGYKIGESATYTLASMAATTATFLVTRNPVMAIAAGTSVITPSVSTDLYKELVDAGAPENRAGEIAIPMGMFLALTESADDLPVLSAISPAFKLLRREITNEVIKRTVLGVLKKGAGTFTTIEVVNAIQEVGQDAMTNVLAREFDKDRLIFEDVDETILQTLIATSPFAIFGGGMSMRYVPPNQAATVPDDQKQTDGWVRDETTGGWFQPQQLEEMFSDRLEENLEQGMTEEQARLKALNEVAKTPEGAEAIETYVEENIVEPVEPVAGKVVEEVTPEPTEVIAPEVVEEPIVPSEVFPPEVPVQEVQQGQFVVPEGVDAIAPVEPRADLTPEQITESKDIAGKPKHTTEQIDALVSVFAEYLSDPSTKTAYDLTRELRTKARGERAVSLKERTQQLIAEGLSSEDALNQARIETMAGELPAVKSDYLDGLTVDMRQALFDKVYNTLKDEPFELMSTSEALTNALTGKPIPRDPGVTGRSAFTRLQSVFGEQLDAIDKIARSGKSLRQVIEGTYNQVGNPPVPLDPAMIEYLRNLSTQPTGQAWLLDSQPALTKLTDVKSREQIQSETDLLKIELANQPVPVVKYEFPIEDAIKQTPLWPSPVRDNVIKVLKEIGWSPVDIGNFIRANKTSFDFSFWRQQGTLMFNHPVTFMQANVDAWKAIWSQKSAEASWQKISRDPLFELYAIAEAKGFDFLRPAEATKGTAQWSGTEEFGYLTGERVIPRMTSKLPWVKISARSFVTGTNSHNWRIFKNHYEAMLRINERYASGELTLKEGEVFSVEKEMIDMARMLGDFTQRASLGGARGTGLVQAINSLMFAPRATLGKILTPRHLISANPRIRMEAWRNLGTFVTIWSSIILLGAQQDLWEVELDPRSAEYMSIRVGNTRIDPWAGHRQLFVFYTRIMTDLVTNRKGGVSSLTGAEYELDPIRALSSFARGKASPLAGIILDFWTGKTFIGDTVDVKDKRQWAERIAPFSVWDIYEAATENNPETAAGVVIPALLGLGVQTYTGEWVENFPKLGLPKYEENLPYGILEPKYTTADFWSDHSAQFTGVDPATLTAEKGFPDYIRSLAEAKAIKDILSDLPSERLININADPSEGTTYGDYYKMWRDREKLVAEGDVEALKDFDTDERTRNAHLGNFSQKQFALIVEYHSILDPKKQSAFFEEHEAELGNPQLNWLKTNPKGNGLLAVWGQVKILTKGSHSAFKSILASLDIPDGGIPPLTLPPETSIDTHFSYEGLVDDGRHQGAEAALLLLKDHLAAEEAGVQSYIDWRVEGGSPLKLTDRTVEQLQIQVDTQVLADKLKDVFTDETLDDIEKDEDGLTEKDRVIAGVRNTKVGDETYHDIERRLDAMNQGTRDVPIPDAVVDSFVKYRAAQDEDGVGAETPEVLLMRVDDLDLNEFLMDRDVWGDNALKPIPPEEIPRLRLIVKGRDLEAQYQDIDPEEKNPTTGLLLRTEMLNANNEFRMDRRRIEAYDKKLDAWVEIFVNYYEQPLKGFRRERMLVDDPGFGRAMQEAGFVTDLPTKVPDVRYDEITEADQELFDEMDGLGNSESIHFIASKTERDARRREVFFNPDGTVTDFYRTDKRRGAYASFVPDKHTENYIQWFVIKAEGKPVGYPVGIPFYEDDFFMMEHLDFYNKVYLNAEIWGTQNERLDFRRVPPTREILGLWIRYNEIINNQTGRDQLRIDNKILDEWAVSVGIWTKTMSEKRRQKGLTATERFLEDIAEARG